MFCRTLQLAKISNHVASSDSPAALMEILTSWPFSQNSSSIYSTRGVGCFDRTPGKEEKSCRQLGGGHIVWLVSGGLTMSTHMVYRSAYTAAVLSKQPSLPNLQVLVLQGHWKSGGWRFWQAGILVRERPLLDQEVM